LIPFSRRATRWVSVVAFLALFAGGGVGIAVTADGLGGEASGMQVPAVALGSPGTITTAVGTPPTPGYGPPGPASSTALADPEAVALDSSGNLYVADTSNCVVWKVSSGQASVVVSNHVCGYSGDGGPATAAEVDFPSALAVDSSGDLYVAQAADCAVREVSASSHLISTVAGTGTCASSTSGGPATSVNLDVPLGVALDPAGNLYVSASQACVVWKVSSGQATPFAGSPGVCGLSGVNGPASAAEIGRIAGIAFDGRGDLYMADPDACTVWEVTVGSGILADFAGLATGRCGDGGDGGPATEATLGQVTGIATDASGDVYIVVNDWCVVREVLASGVIETVVGSEPPTTCGYGGDGGPPTSAELWSPRAVAVVSPGTYFIADSLNNAIRQVTGQVVATTTTTASSSTSSTTTTSTSSTTTTPSSSTSSTTTAASSTTSTTTSSTSSTTTTVPPGPLTGPGYWLVAADGGVFSFGDAGFFGSAVGLPLAKPVVGMASTPDGHGYWLVASDGGVFSFGDAGFFGSAGGLPLAKPVVGMAPTPDGHGYWLVAADGGIFTYGDALGWGSLGGVPLASNAVGMATDGTSGYWIATSDGSVFAMGQAPFLGSAGGLALRASITGLAAS
jgi:sugar lactone lactonase YvrE